MLVVIISFIIRLQRYNKNLKYSYYYLKKKVPVDFCKKIWQYHQLYVGRIALKETERGQTDECAVGPLFSMY